MEMRLAFAAALVAFIAGPGYAQGTDQHSVDGLVSALTTQLSQEAISRAREFDDSLLGEGHTGEQRVYLVTDERSRKVNEITSKLLTAMGHDPRAWVVRVLDTKPPVSNAFVVGGRYVYVFTGFLQEAESDDEVAFVLGHELGHSLLKHGERQQSDFSMQLAGLLALIGELAKGKTAENLTGFAHSMQAQYSQQEEAEADALGAAIAIRSGFDPLRGVDFFTRSVRKQDEERPGASLSDDQLQAMRVELSQLQATCLQGTNAWNSRQIAQTQANADQVNSICADAENKRVAFNQASEEFYMARAQKVLDGLTSTHPDSQSRVAALAATVDFLAGRRDVESLLIFRNAGLVMQALRSTDSVLLHAASDSSKATASTARAPNPKSGEDATTRLEKLKNAYDSGLITKEEYDAKRKELLSEL